MQLRYMAWKYWPPELRRINRITQGSWLLETRRKEIPEGIKYRYVSLPAINQGLSRKFLLNLQSLRLIFRKYNPSPDLMANGNICSTLIWSYIKIQNLTQ